MSQTIPEILFERADESPDAIACWAFDDGVWKSATWTEALQDVALIGDRLRALDLKPGAKVALVAETRAEWTTVDFAALCLGCVTVGIYPSLLGDQIAWQVQHAEAEVLVLENARQVEKLRPFLQGLTDLKAIWTIDAVEGFDALANGAAVASRSGDVAALRRDASAVKPEHSATIIYTSGTTGEPKGVLLSHGAFVAVVHATSAALPYPSGMRGVGFLPLAHSLQRFAGYLAVFSGVEGYYAPSIAALASTIRDARPHLLASVPRMLVKIKQAVEAGVAEKGPRAQAAYDWAMTVAHDRADLLRRGEAISVGLHWKWRLADRLVLSKIRKGLGGSLEIMACGGAALEPSVAQWYHALGILVLEGWGLTETCAPATANREDRFKFGTVGSALDGVELKIAEDGEVLVKSVGMFSGYYKNEAATSEAFTADGWFCTGDIGSIDEDGFLRILDRKKAIIVTAGGKNIAPTPIEERLEVHEWIDQAVVIGDERPYLIALIVPDFEKLALWAGRQDLAEGDREAWIAHDQVRASVREAIDAANQPVARFEQVKRWATLTDGFTIENGCLTPTMKLKRRIVTDRHARLIDAVYAVQQGEGIVREDSRRA
jgi:long-chain acyl-CoA synthetase